MWLFELLAWAEFIEILLHFWRSALIGIIALFLCCWAAFLIQSENVFWVACGVTGAIWAWLVYFFEVREEVEDTARSDSDAMNVNMWVTDN